MQTYTFLSTPGISIPAVQFNTITHTSSLPVNGRVSLISTMEGLMALETQWRELEQSASAPVTVFQSFDWISSWCSAYLDPRSDTELLVLTGYQNQKLVFIWPLMKTSRYGLGSVEWLSSPSGQYGDGIVAKDQNIASWYKSGVELLKRLRGIDLLRLRHVRADASIYPYAHQEMTNSHNPERAPYLDLTAFADAEAYEQRYTSSQKKRRKKIRKSLEELGEVKFSVISKSVFCERTIEAAIAEKTEWLKERGRINRVMACPRHLDFIKRLTRRQGSNVEVVISELSAGGKPISWEIGFRFGGTHFAYLTSHVNAMTDLSPGRLHMDLSQKQAIADGMQRFDLMVPYDIHKESWCSGMESAEDFHMALSAKGAVYGAIYVRLLRPLFRSVYYRLPQNVLNYFAPLTKKFS